MSECFALTDRALWSELLWGVSELYLGTKVCALQSNDSAKNTSKTNDETPPMRWIYTYPRQISIQTSTVAAMESRLPKSLSGFPKSRIELVRILLVCAEVLTGTPGEGLPVKPGSSLSSTRHIWVSSVTHENPPYSVQLLKTGKSLRARNDGYYVDKYTYYFRCSVLAEVRLDPSFPKP